MNGSCPLSTATAGITYVQAEWNVPTVVNTNASANEFSSTWVGIGGNDGSGSLVQAGTEEDASAAGSTTYAAWIELLPAGQTLLSLTIHPGDLVSVGVGYKGSDGKGGQSWYFRVYDLTSGAEVERFADCDPGTCALSSFSSAEWIEESTALCGGGACFIQQIPAFSTVVFTDLLYEVGGSGGSGGTYLRPTDLATAADLVELYLTSPLYSGCAGDPWDSPLGWHQCIVVDPGALEANEFFVEYMVNIDTCGTPTLGFGCVQTGQPGVDIGLDFESYLWIESLDSFSYGRFHSFELGMSIHNATSGETCSDSFHDKLQTPGIAGSFTADYGRLFTTCQADVIGRYSIAMGIWYVPSGTSLGGLGTLMVAETGWSSSTGWSQPWLPYAWIQVNPSLSAGPVTPTAPWIPHGGSVLLSAHPLDGTPAYAYQWYDGSSSQCADDAPIHPFGAGASDRVSPSQSTYFCYLVTDTVDGSTVPAAEAAFSPTDLVSVGLRIPVCFPCRPLFALLDSSQSGSGSKGGSDAGWWGTGAGLPPLPLLSSVPSAMGAGPRMTRHSSWPRRHGSDPVPKSGRPIRASVT